eukprot:1324805-Pyramimonas_sp.AAC.2
MSSHAMRTSLVSGRSLSSGRVTFSTAASRAPGTAARRRVVKTEAFFGPFGKKESAGPMICLDCGYVVESGFESLPRNYKCPVCNVGKARFKPAPKSAGSRYSSMSAEKAARKAAKANTSKDGMSAREKMIAAQIEMQNQVDGEKKKKKGWF